MNCANCGTPNPASNKFCLECGAALSAACLNCGTPYAPGTKFCGECGTAVTGAPPSTAASAGAVRPAATAAAPGTPPGDAAERRLVSVLFADLVGFTPFAEERDAEEVRETLSRYFETARQVIERYGGTIEKFIGDAVMAVWGAPTAQEDDAERAVRAALDLVDRVPSIAPAPGIQARAGVLTGEAAITMGAINEGMVVGDLVNTASRLQSVAEPGTVLVGEATQRATSSAIAYEKVADKELKGKMSPVPAWRAMRVVAQVGGRGRSETLEAPFVGRQAEMRLLKDLFHATNRESRPRLVSIIGPGGIGKSRLAWEFEKYIDGLSELVWWHDGRSPAYGEAVTFWALGEMVRQRAGLIETDDEATTRAKLAETLRERVPDAAERATVERALLVLLGFETGVDPQHLFGAWRMFFERLADTGPVVMVFEDLHFADPGLLDFIDHMLDWSRSSPITIITLARPELLEKRSTWGAGKRNFTSIYLDALSEADMQELLAGLVPGLPQKAINAIVARADGVPLYAVETVRMLLAQGRLQLEEGVYQPAGDLEDIAVPETLTALIAARLDGLDPADRALVADASVLGHTFTMAALSALASVPQEALEPRLDSLARRELLRHETDPRSPELGQYAFVQALIREVAYNTLSKKDRKARHLAAARYFESTATGEVAGALAGHYLAAYRSAPDGPEADALKAQARIALRGAAERASSLGSHEQAIRFLEQALEITSDPAERADFHRRAFLSAFEGTASATVLRHGEAAIAAYREVGDRSMIAESIADLTQALRMGSGDPKRSLEMLTEAWEEFKDLEQTPAGVKLMTQIAGSYGALNDVSDIEWRERAIPIAERLDMVEELARLLIGLGATHANVSRPRQGMMTLRGAHAMAAEIGTGLAERQGRNLLSFFEQWGDPQAGLQLVRDGFDIARRIGSTSYAFLMVGNGVVCAIRVGEWDWAAEVLEQWIPSETENDQFAEFRIDHAVLNSLRGQDSATDLARAEELLAGYTDPQFDAYLAWAHAWQAFSAGRFADSAIFARKAIDAAAYFQPLVVMLAARASLWAGDPAGARAVMEEFGRTLYRGRALSIDKASIAAGIAALEGRTAEALAGYREAFRGARALGIAWDEALTAIDAAKFLGTGDPDLNAEADWARQTLTRLGAQPYLERLEAALAADESTAVQQPVSAEAPVSEAARAS